MEQETLHADPCEEGGQPSSEAIQEVDESEYPTATFFEEHQECEDILRAAALNFPSGWIDLVPADDSTVASFQLFEKYLQKYQEQPQLIKHHLGSLVSPLMDLIAQRMPTLAMFSSKEYTSTTAAGTTQYALGQEYSEYDVDAPRTPLHHVCRCLYFVVKVAGPKSCTSYFPHDVKVLENVFYALNHWQREPHLRREWEVRYCFLLWLSNLILVPFALHTIDSSITGEVGATLSQQLLRLAFGLLKDTSKCREAAALLIARMMARADGHEHRLEFFTFAKEMLENKALDSVTLHGVLQALATTLKLGKRRELLPFAPSLIPLVVVVAGERTTDAKLCKTAVKVLQRLGLCLLKQKSASWKYVKAVGSLQLNLTGHHEEDASRTADNDDEDDDAIECDDGLEEVIGVLIESLSHPDTVVRWSAAKGIGRVCNRLPQEMADDVIDSFMEVFDVMENDSGWHGGLLAVAELCRRSILLPTRFNAVLPIVSKGLMFDLSRGTYSVGSHVRDAACYVCWSVARAYNATDLEPYVHRLSTSLVVASLFDREVNVRRAAAAALQECVGRLGNFPNGIDLVTTMDFFSLATMRGSFLQVAPLVAKYESYRLHMLQTLVDVKLVHWDKEVRRTASKAFGLLAPICKDHVINVVIPQTLMTRVKDAGLSTRHGAICAIAEAIANIPFNEWPPSLIAAIANIVPWLDAGRHFRGRGGELIRQACLRLLEACASQGLELPDFVEVEKVSGEKAKARTLGKLQVFFEDTWKQILEWLQLEAVSSFRVFAAQYYRTFQEGFHAKMMSAMLEGAKEGKAAMERRGTVLALGGLPPVLLLAPLPSPPAEQSTLFLHAVMSSLQSAATLEANADLRDAETRRNAVESLVRVVTSIPCEPLRDPLVMTSQSFQGVVNTLAAAFNDYATDKRGDVGSFVRIEAIHSSVTLLEHMSKRSSQQSPKGSDEDFLWNKGYVLRLVSLILQQSVEKIDRVRGVAGGALHRLLSSDSFFASLLSLVANSEQDAKEIAVLKQCVVHSGVTDWGSPKELFEALVPRLLQTHLFARCVMEGIIVSVGGLSIHVLKPSLQALIDGFRLAASESGHNLSFVIIQVAAMHLHDDRFVVPLCLTVDRLINVNLFDESRFGDLVDIIITETKHFSSDIQKLLPLTGVLGTVCRAGDPQVRQAAWQHALSLLVSRYPKVRAKMGTDLYTALLFLSSSSAEQQQQQGSDVRQPALLQAMDHLIKTRWDDSNATTVRGAKNELYDMLCLEKPSKESGGMKEQSTTSGKMKPDSYSYLVHEAGY